MHVVFWAWLLQEANASLILFWTELGQAENFLIAPHSLCSVVFNIENVADADNDRNDDDDEGMSDDIASVLVMYWLHRRPLSTSHNRR